MADTLEDHPKNDMNTPPPLLAVQNPLCRTCGQGLLSRLKTFRMSGPVVVIGFIMLVPSILGMLFGLLMLIGTGAAGTQVSASTENEARAGLVAQGVPEAIVNEVVSGKTVSNSELAKLPPRQQSAVQTAQISHTAGQVGTGAATVILGGFSIFVFIMSFVGGLLGWLLVMRKAVLKCSRCGAVVPAS